MRLTVVLCVLSAAEFCLAQAPIKVDVNQAEEPIRVGVNLVNVTFVARDAGGKAVTDLAREEVEVFEDGVPQTVAFFARSADVPLALAIAVDFSGSQEHSLKKHHKDLQTFLREALGPRDRVSLICFGNFLRLVSNSTASGDSLIEGLQRFEKGERGFPLVGPREVRTGGTAFYDTVYYPVTELLVRAENMRRALIVLSDGEDNSSSHHMLEAIESAQAAGAPIFCIRYTEIAGDGPIARNRYGTEVMERLAHETGGSHIDAAKTDLRSAFRRIGEELRTSYELAYHSTNATKDGTFRKIAIRLKRPGATTRAKTGYIAR